MSLSRVCYTSASNYVSYKLVLYNNRIQQKFNRIDDEVLSLDEISEDDEVNVDAHEEPFEPIEEYTEIATDFENNDHVCVLMRAFGGVSRGKLSLIL